MKKIISILILTAIALASFAQQTYVILVQDTVAQKYRFQRVEIRQYESVSDTLVTDRFPDKWLTATELKAYQEQLIDSYNERFAELSRLRRSVKDEVDVHVSYYDNIQGAGAYLSYQKARVQASLQGSWKLVERNGTTDRTDITITDLVFRRNQARFGTITINDDLSLTLSGYFNFNLQFVATPSGEWRAERSGRLYILRK
jgi:hypothetical protein